MGNTFRIFHETSGFHPRVVLVFAFRLFMFYLMVAPWHQKDCMGFFRIYFLRLVLCSGEFVSFSIGIFFWVCDPHVQNL